MTEVQVGFLCNIASNLSSNNNTQKLLRSYYLMRCNELSKGYGLPKKYFSAKVRCPHCCLEWARNTDVKVQPLRQNKKLQQKNRSQKSDHIRNSFEETRSLSNRNQMVQICSFCKQSTTTNLIKPEKEYIKSTNPKNEQISISTKQQKEEKSKATKRPDIKRNINKPKLKNNAVVNVYSNAFDVFSLKNEKNTILSSIKEPSKAIKNSKRKKDKYAGLCQKAVLASAKFKQQKVQIQKEVPKSNLNLFLKPSPG